MTLIQRFGSALNLNVHYHMLFLDGVYAEDDYGKQRFHRVKAPTYDELNTLAHTLSHRIARCMESDVAGMAAPVACQTELSPHARTY